MTDRHDIPVVNPPEILYRLKGANGELLYVGITRDWPSRMKQHQADKLWWPDVRNIELVYVDGTRPQIEAIEKAVIKAEQPRFNKVHNERRMTLPDSTRERVVAAALAPLTRQPQPDREFKLGEDVWHPTFGEGIIIDVRGHGEKAEVSVRFPGVGTKHLSTAWAPLVLASERDQW